MYNFQGFQVLAPETLPQVFLAKEMIMKAYESNLYWNIIFKKLGILFLQCHVLNSKLLCFDESLEKILFFLIVYQSFAFYEMEKKTVGFDSVASRYHDHDLSVNTFWS